MKYPIITYKQMCKILKRNKYHFDRYSGDHAIYKNVKAHDFNRGMRFINISSEMY